MLRSILYLIGLSVAAVFLKTPLIHALHFFMYLHNQIGNGLKVIFSDDSVGKMLQSVLSLLLIPIVLGIVIGLIHFVVKQDHFPHTMTVIWICWAVLLVASLSGMSKSGALAQNSPTATQQVGPNGQPQQMAQAPKHSHFG